MFCTLLFNFVNYVLLLLVYVILLLRFIVMFMYFCCYIYVFVWLRMFCSVYFVSLCCSVYCFLCKCVLYYCHRVSTQLQFTNTSYRITSSYHILSYHIIYRMVQKERMFLISACDFFLWGYLKSKVCVRKPRTVDDLKVPIREEIATVPQEMLVNVMQNFEERLRTCVRQEGRHLSDIVFCNWVINVSNKNCVYYRLFFCIENKKVTIIWKNAFFLRHCI